MFKARGLNCKNLYYYPYLTRAYNLVLALTKVLSLPKPLNTVMHAEDSHVKVLRSVGGNIHPTHLSAPLVQFKMSVCCYDTWVSSIFQM